MNEPHKPSFSQIRHRGGRSPSPDISLVLAWAPTLSSCSFCRASSSISAVLAIVLIVLLVIIVVVVIFATDIAVAVVVIAI